MINSFMYKRLISLLYFYLTPFGNLLSFKKHLKKLKLQGYDLSNFLTPSQAKKLKFNEVVFTYNGIGDSLLLRHTAEIYYHKTGVKLLLAVNHPEFFVNTDFVYVLNFTYAKAIRGLLNRLNKYLQIKNSNLFIGINYFFTF